MTQRRRHSAVEAVISTAIGFVISYAIWPPVSVLVLHKPARAAEGLAVIGIYTAVSVVRGYVVRRAFNRIQARGQRCYVCDGAAAILQGNKWLCRYHGGKR